MDNLEFRRGEIDGRKDGAVVGVKSLADTVLARLYSPDYIRGYRYGYEKAQNARTGERVNHG
jgi:hypothetical protein